MRFSSKLAIIIVALSVGLGMSDANASWSKANVSGSYGFQFTGFDEVVTKTWIVGTGELIANGKGAITGGSITYNDGGDVCIGTLVTSSYTVVADGEGTLNLQFSIVSGTCPISPTFDFAIALALPNSAATPIATLLQLNTTSVVINGVNETAVMIGGNAHLL